MIPYEYKKKSMSYGKWHCGKLEETGAGVRLYKRRKDNSDKQQKENEENKNFMMR